MISVLDWEKLPEVCGLYLVMNAEEKVIYVGQSINIQKRWKNGHHKLSSIMKHSPKATIRWVELPHARLNHAEYMAVRFYDPILNSCKPSIV